MGEQAEPATEANGENHRHAGRPRGPATDAAILQAATDYDEIAPNRQRLAEELRTTAVADGFRTDVDPTLPFDLIVGATLNHLLATGSTPSEADTAKMVEVVVQGLRRRD